MDPAGVRFESDALRVLEHAQALARRHQHETVEPVHLLAALDARLCARPGAALYREARSAAAPALSPAVGVLLRQAASAHDPEFAGVTTEKLLSALWYEPSLAPIIEESRIDQGDLDSLLDEAHDLAVARGHAHVTVHHVLAVVQDEEWFSAAMAACSADATKLRARIETHLHRLPAKTEEASMPLRISLRSP